MPSARARPAAGAADKSTTAQQALHCPQRARRHAGVLQADSADLTFEIRGGGLVNPAGRVQRAFEHPHGVGPAKQGRVGVGQFRSDFEPVFGAGER
jgi:hypothetical protein